MSEETIRSESSQEIRDAETATERTETPQGLTELDRRLADALVQTAIGGRAFESAREQAKLWLRGKIHFADLEDQPGPLPGLTGMSGEELNILTIPAGEWKELSAKTAEILNESALAHQRIAKDQEEIEQLKLETRELLKHLRAA